MSNPPKTTIKGKLSFGSYLELIVFLSICFDLGSFVIAVVAGFLITRMIDFPDFSEFAVSFILNIVIFLILGILSYPVYSWWSKHKCKTIQLIEFSKQENRDQKPTN